VCLCISCCVFYCDVSGRLVLLLLINWLIDWKQERLSRTNDFFACDNCASVPADCPRQLVQKHGNCGLWRFPFHIPRKRKKVQKNKLSPQSNLLLSSAQFCVFTRRKRRHNRLLRQSFRVGSRHSAIITRPMMIIGAVRRNAPISCT